MTEHTLRAGITIDGARWLFAGVAGGFRASLAFRSKRPATVFEMLDRRRSLHQSAPVVGRKLLSRLGLMLHFDVHARLNPHRAR